MSSRSRSTDSSQWSRKRRLALYALATLIPVVVFFLGLEGIGRAYIYVKYGVPGKSYGLWRYDETLGAQHREDAYNTRTQTNNFGFRNQEPVARQKPLDTLRIIAYGGSTTFCYNLSDSESWPIQLQRLLRQSDHTSHQVLNAGAIMWSIGHAYARATKDIPALKPDYVIVYSGINEDANARFLAAKGEPMNSLVKEGKYGKFATNLDQNRWMKRNLVTVRLLDYVAVPWIRRLQSQVISTEISSHSSPDPAILENYLHVLDQFLDLVDSNGARAIFVIQAHDGSKVQNEYLTSYSRSGAALARKKKAIVVDAAKLLDIYRGNSKDLFYHTGVHYSALGAQMLAELLYTEVFADTMHQKP